MTDDTIESALIAAGHKPGTAIDAPTLRRFAMLIEREAIAACEEIQARYPIRPCVTESVGDALIRQGRNVALSCANAVRERLQ
jgi:hypothetical protein